MTFTFSGDETCCSSLYGLICVWCSFNAELQLEGEGYQMAGGDGGRDSVSASSHCQLGPGDGWRVTRVSALRAS